MGELLIDNMPVTGLAHTVLVTARLEGCNRLARALLWLLVHAGWLRMEGEVSEIDYLPVEQQR